MSGSLRYLRHFTAGSMLVCALLVLVLALTVATAVACVVACVLYVSGLYGWLSPWPLRLLPIGAVAANVAVAQGAPEVWPSAAVPALIVSAALTATAWPRLPVTGIGLAVTGVVVVLVTRDWPAALTTAGATALCVTALMAQLWVWEIAARSDRERSRDAETAVDRERQRFAADLHDIQGHSLQVIVLKSELAARLAEVDPARAAAEMRAVEALARDALRDTREVAHGYRAVALETEIANAVGVLEAAGVRCRTSLPALGRVPPAAGRLLALVVREATTNLLRHSAATEAGIVLTAGPDGLGLTVRNDGPLAVKENDGQGLAGLAARFAVAGGRVRWASEAGHFEVAAELPG
jgi:two-component system sensor histidine kinase DesK